MAGFVRSDRVQWERVSQAWLPVSWRARFSAWKDTGIWLVLVILMMCVRTSPRMMWPKSRIYSGSWILKWLTSAPYWSFVQIWESMRLSSISCAQRYSLKLRTSNGPQMETRNKVLLPLEAHTAVPAIVPVQAPWTWNWACPSDKARGFWRRQAWWAGCRRTADPWSEWTAFLDNRPSVQGALWWAQCLLQSDTL